MDCLGLQELKCEACGNRPAMSNDILCRECSEKYAALLQSARSKTGEIFRTMAGSTEQEIVTLSDWNAGQGTQTLLRHPISENLPELIHEQIPLQPKHFAQLVGYLLLGFGFVALTASILVASTILTFIGLGLVFWGVLTFFVQPQKYVRSDLMNATAMSTLSTIDRIMIGLGYREQGVYIPVGKEKTVVFVPSEPFSRIPEGAAIEGKTFLSNPQGMLVAPPGLALASLIEKKLDFTLRNAGVEALVRALPKALVEDLEISRDVEIQVAGDKIKIKLIDSIYDDFCKEMRETSRRCGFGCPMCSALACVIATASGKPVMVEEEESSHKGETLSSFQLINEQRL